MSEIKIEKKSPVWPWMLAGLIVISALIYYFVFRNTDDPQVAQTLPDTTEENQHLARV